jgi:hypothetical protein
MKETVEMMETVAYLFHVRDEIGNTPTWREFAALDFTPGHGETILEQWALVRRSDAEAEIASLQARVEELERAVRDLLDTGEAEAKATLAAQVATENFSDPRPEQRQQTAAMLAASAAEKRARAALAAAPKPGGDHG